MDGWDGWAHRDHLPRSQSTTHSIQSIPRDEATTHSIRVDECVDTFISVRLSIQLQNCGASDLVCRERSDHVGIAFCKVGTVVDSSLLLFLSSRLWFFTASGLPFQASSATKFSN